MFVLIIWKNKNNSKRWLKIIYLSHSESYAIANVLIVHALGVLLFLTGKNFFVWITCDKIKITCDIYLHESHDVL